jgi:hypothetical protein
MSGQGPPTAPLWQRTQRFWKIGETSGQRGAGSGQTVGAVMVQTSGAPSPVVGPPSNRADVSQPMAEEARAATSTTKRIAESYAGVG